MEQLPGVNNPTVSYDLPPEEELVPVVNSPTNKSLDNSLVTSPPTNMLVDERTNAPVGAYTEDEIAEDTVKIFATAATFDVPEDKIYDFIVPLTPQIDANAEKHTMYTNISDITRVIKDVTLKNAEANRSLVKYLDTKDARFLDEYKALRDEVSLLSSEIPQDLRDRSKLTEIWGAWVQMGAQLYDMGKEKLPSVARDTAAGLVIGSSLTPLGAVGAGVLSAKTSALYHTADYMRTQGIGEIYSRIDAYVNEETGEEIPSFIAEQVAREWSLPYAASETAGTVIEMLSNFTPSSSLVARLKGILAEGGTEGIQTAFEQLALWDARRRTAKLRGREFTQTWQDALNSYEINESIRLASLAATGPFVVGGVTSAAINTSKKYSVSAIRKLQEQNKTYQAERHAKKVIEKSRQEKSKIAEVSQKAEVDTVNELTGEVEKGEPILKIEEDKAAEDTQLPGTTITDDTIKDLTLLDDEDGPEAIRDIIGDTQESVSEKAQSFLVGLYLALPEKHAKAVEELVGYRASALGMSIDEYISNKGLQFNLDETEDKNLKANIHFLDEHTTIITAFQNADLSSVVHELGHVFRSDLKPEQQAIADDFVGVDRGANWDKDAEEKFARAFERYITEGQAPNAKMAELFAALSRWMLNIYKSIKGSEIETPVSPELAKVFDQMLVKEDATKKGLIENKMVGRKFEQRAKDSVEESLKKKVDEEVAYRESKAKFIARVKRRNIKNMKLEDAVVAQLEEQRQLARDLFDAGENHGYQKAVNRMKASLTRVRETAANQNKHKALTNKLVKTIRDAAKTKMRNKVRTSNMDLDTKQFFIDLFAEVEKFTTLKNVKAGYKEYVMEDRRATQDYFDKVLGIDADRIFKNPNSGGLTTVEIVRNAILHALVSRNKYGVDRLIEIQKAIQELIKDGKSDSPFMKLLDKKKKIVKVAVKEANGGNDLAHIKDTDRASVVRQEQKKRDIEARLRTSRFGKSWLMGLESILDLVGSYTEEEGSYNGILSKTLSFFEAKQKKMTEARVLKEEAQTAFMFFYNIDKKGLTKGEYSYNSRLTELNKPQWDIKDGTGSTYSTAELMDIYIHSMIPADRVQLANSIGNDNISLDTILANVNSYLTDADKKYAEWMHNKLASKSMYDYVNQTHIEQFGFPLHKVEKYWPKYSQRLSMDLKEYDRANRISQFTHDQDTRKKPQNTGHVKERVKNADEVTLKISSAISKFNNYVDEMTHFVNYSELGRLGSMLLSDKDLKRAIRVEYGKDVYKELEVAFYDTLADSVDARNNHPMIDAFRSNIIVSQIGLATTVMGKQYISIVNWADKMPIYDYVIGLADFLKKPRENYAKLKAKGFMVNRASNLERDIKKAHVSAEYKKWQLNPSITNLFMVLLRIGDAGGFIGAHAYDLYLKKQVNEDGSPKFTQKEIDTEVFKSGNRTQQSGDLEQLSRAQRGGSIAKLASMYSTGPVQGGRRIHDAMRAYYGGRISRQQFIKTCFIYYVLVPSLYSLASSAITGEDGEDAMKHLALSAAIGPFGSMYSVGRTFSTGVNALFGLPYYANSGPFNDIVFDIVRYGNKAMKNGFSDLTLDDTARVVEGMLTPWVGVPLTRITRTGENLLEGDIPEAVFAQNPNR